MSIHQKFSLAAAVSFALYATAASAAPGSTSAYTTDPQSTHVEDATSQGVGQVNMITCIAAAMKMDALVNKGDYNALVDEAKCDPSAASSGSASTTQAPTYTNAVVNSSRTSNTDPMLAKIWLVESEQDSQKTIFVRASASAPPSDSNPYGVFRLDFCGHAAGDSSATCLMNGYLDTSTSGVTYYETENRNDNGTAQTQTVALKLTAAATTSGSGTMLLAQGSDQAGFNFAYNSSLFRRADGDGNNDQCFSRDASDPETGQSVWRYGLYDSVSGTRVDRNSGFPIEYTTGGHTYQGFLGYYGLQLPPDAMSALTNGATVQKVDYSTGSAPTKTDYSVVVAGGKMTKYTRQTRSLHGLDKIKFTTMIGNAAGFFVGATNNTQYEMYWDDATLAFKVSGRMDCGGNNGCQTVALQTEQTVNVSFWQMMGGVQGFSQSLGGEVFIDLHGATSVGDSSAVNVVYRIQDLVYPSQLPATLYCVRDCPTAGSLNAYFMQNSASSPYTAATANNWNPTPVGSVVTYHTDGTQPVLLDAGSAPVVFTNASAYQQHQQFSYGVRSGRLFATLSDAACTNGGQSAFCDYKVNDIDVYYQWETGPNSSNQFAAVKNSSGAYVTFDAPLNVTYDVPNNPMYKEYAGKSIVLQYGGFGDLWGIPGICVSPLTNAEVPCSNDGSTRYVPSFVIPYNTTTGKVKNGSTEYLVKWLDREIRFAKKNLSVCTSAGLTLPSGVTLPNGSDLRNPSDPNSQYYIGVKPTVTDAPRVIHGEVKY